MLVRFANARRERLIMARTLASGCARKHTKHELARNVEVATYVASHQNWMDGVRSLLDQRALRCRKCHFRFYGRPGQAFASQAAASDGTKRVKKIAEQ